MCLCEDHACFSSCQWPYGPQIAFQRWAWNNITLCPVSREFQTWAGQTPGEYQSMFSQLIKVQRFVINCHNKQQFTELLSSIALRLNINRKSSGKVLPLKKPSIIIWYIKMIKNTRTRYVWCHGLRFEWSQMPNSVNMTVTTGLKLLQRVSETLLGTFWWFCIHVSNRWTKLKAAMVDYYDVLGVSRNASPDDIKKAWVKTAFTYQ